MRLGGVPMSVMMPPMLLAKARGIMSMPGWVPEVLAMASTMGSSRATVPVLLTKAATQAVTSTTRKKSFFWLVPARRSRRPLMVRARPVWNTAPPTTKRPTIMMTALLENPANASDGVSTPVASKAAMEQSATMSDRIFPTRNNTIVAKKMTRVAVIR